MHDKILLPAAAVPSMLRDMAHAFGRGEIRKVDAEDGLIFASGLREMARQVESLLVHAREITRDRNELMTFAADTDPHMEELCRKAADLRAFAAQGAPPKPLRALPDPDHANVVHVPFGAFARPRVAPPMDGGAA